MTIEALTPNHGQVENMYICLREAGANPYTERFYSNWNLLQDICEPDPNDDNVQVCDAFHIDIIYHLNSHFQSPSSLLMHVVIRVLTVVAPTLKHLYISFGGRRTLVFPPIELPRLTELTIIDKYNWTDNEVPVLKNLRRLRIFDSSPSAGDGVLASIATHTPYLTHLRIDHRNPYSELFSANLQHSLRCESPSSQAMSLPSEVGSSQGALESMAFPTSLKRLLIQPDYVPRPRCSYGRHELMTGRRALHNVVKSDSRLFLFIQRLSRFHADGLDEWLKRINGHLAYWEEKDSDL